MSESFEYIFTHFTTAQLNEWMVINPHRFEALVELAISPEEKYSRHGAWMLGKWVVGNEDKMPPYIPKMLECIPIVCDSQKRDLLNVLRQVEIGEDHEGILFDQSVKIWSDVGKMPSLRYHAMRVILKIAVKYPDLKNEIDLITSKEYVETLSGGVRNSLGKMLEDYEKKL